MTTQTTKPAFKKFDEVFVNRAGFPLAIGSRVVVACVSNEGTKRNPTFRYQADGLWFYESDLSANANG